MNHNLHNLRLSIKIILAAFAVAFVLPLVVSAAPSSSAVSISGGACPRSFEDMAKREAKRDKAFRKIADKAEAKAKKLGYEAAGARQKSNEALKRAGNNPDNSDFKAAKAKADKATRKADEARKTADAAEDATIAGQQKAARKAQNLVKADARIAAAQEALEASRANDVASSEVGALQAEAAAARAAAASAASKAEADAAQARLNAAQAALNQGGGASPAIQEAAEDLRVAQNARARIANSPGSSDLDIYNTAAADFKARRNNANEGKPNPKTGKKEKLSDINAEERASAAEQACGDRAVKEAEIKALDKCNAIAAEANAGCKNGIICGTPQLVASAPQASCVGGKLKCSVASADCYMDCRCKSPPPGAPPEAIDLCGNLPGFQDVIPDGWYWTSGYLCYPNVPQRTPVGPPDRTIPPPEPPVGTIQTGVPRGPQMPTIGGETLLQRQQRIGAEIGIQQALQGATQSFGPSILRGPSSFSR